MHVAQSWHMGEQHESLSQPCGELQGAPPTMTSSDPPPQPLWGSLHSQAPHLRGAPSAISMAVIPRDQMSLCRGERRRDRSMSLTALHTHHPLHPPSGPLQGHFLVCTPSRGPAPADPTPHRQHTTTPSLCHLARPHPQCLQSTHHPIPVLPRLPPCPASSSIPCNRRWRQGSRHRR